MKERSVKATIRYLKLMDYKHLGSINGFEVFEDDEGYIVFVNTTWSMGEFKESNVDTLRYEAETAMVQWFNDHDEICDIPIRVDEVQINIIKNDRAIIRHKVNAINSDWR